LQVRLAIDFGMTPTEVGERFSAKDVGRILAFRELEAEAIEKQRREAELQSKASRERGKV